METDSKLHEISLCVEVKNELLIEFHADSLPFQCISASVFPESVYSSVSIKSCIISMFPCNFPSISNSGFPKFKTDTIPLNVFFL